MEVYLHLQRAQHSFDIIKGVPSLRGLDGGVLFSLLFCCHPLGLEPPPRFFPIGKTLSSPFKRDNSFSLFCKTFFKVPALEGEVDSKTPVFEDGGVLFRCLFLLQFVRLGTPSEIFSVGKTLSSPF